MCKILINNGHQLITIENIGELTGFDVKQYLHTLAFTPGSYYLVSNSKIVSDTTVLKDENVHLIPKVLGGKGGFGSMLRAIGAQIEKTTNREACRDLSGRRLRDINEEQRLKNWINNQAEREKEAKERKKKKLERLIEKPKHEFKDDEYFKEREVLPELVEDAVIKGLQASTSSKRKPDEAKEVVKRKKPKLWVDDELDDLSSDIDSASDSEEKAKSDDKSKNLVKGTEENLTPKSAINDSKCKTDISLNENKDDQGQ